MARTTKFEQLLAEIPDRRHGVWWRYFVAHHDRVARALQDRTRSMPDVVLAIAKEIGQPPVTRASAWETWKSAQAHVARIRGNGPARTPPSAPRARPAPIAAPAPPAPASKPGRPVHPSKILRDDDAPKRHVHSSKLFD